MTLADKFHEVIEIAVDASGVYPHQCITVAEDGKNIMQAIDGSINDLFKHIREQMKCSVELVFGMDFTTRPGQGTEFADVLVFGWWRPGRKKDEWTVGVINYQNEPRIIRPIDWKNAHWNVEFRKYIRSIDPYHDYRVKSGLKYTEVLEEVRKNPAVMRPKLTKKQLENYRKDFDETKKGVEDGTIKGASSVMFDESVPFNLELYFAGAWIEERLNKLGITDEKKIRDAQFFMGRRVWPTNNPWVEAASVVRIYENGGEVPEQPS